MELLRLEATVLALGGTVLSFDREGRPYHLFLEGQTYRRGLDGRLHRVRPRGLSPLDREEALGLYAQALALAEAGLRDPLRRAEVLRWTPEALADPTLFRRAYPYPVSILPPDQYLAVVFQATWGCTWNRCSFCALYRDRSFRVQPLPDFLEHLEAVLELLGRGLALRRGVFLGDGNALVLGEGVAPYLEAVGKVLPGWPVAGFLDLWTGLKRDPKAWTRLRGLGLEAVYLGLESGAPEVLALLNKPGDPREALGLVRGLKAAGLRLGLIFLVGAGGEALKAVHFQKSLDLLRALPLDRGDLVYLSPLVLDPRAPYGGLGLGEVRDLEGEMGRWTQAVRGLGLRVSRYDIRRFVY